MFCKVLLLIVVCVLLLICGVYVCVVVHLWCAYVCMCMCVCVLMQACTYMKLPEEGISSSEAEAGNQHKLLFAIQG